MNLDDLASYQQYDRQNMIAHINHLPQTLLDGWEMAQPLPLPEISGLRNIIMAGMGGSAVGADLLEAYIEPSCRVPITIHRDYGLPGWAQGPETLVIASSHSGNTEETLTSLQQAQARGCRAFAVTTGGKLAQLGESIGIPVWQYRYAGQPRSAVGISFSLLLAAFFRLGLIDDPLPVLQETVTAMRDQQTGLMPETPVSANPAKRMAGQMMGRGVMLIAADYLAPVGRRWKHMINEVAKNWASFETLPEADHNTVAGLNHPENVLMQTISLFLEAPENYTRNHLRLEYTRQIFMTQGMNTDTVQAKGKNRLAHLWTLLHFGDYTSYYLAIANGEDPTPVDIILALKEAMGGATTAK